MKTTVIPKGKMEIRCCIDIGSSFIRLLAVSGVFDRPGAQAPRVVGERRVFVGWGEDLVRRGLISADAAGRAGVVLEDLVRWASGLGCSRPLVVAANILRGARNRRDVVRLLEERSGAEVRVLSGRGEAALGFTGAVSLLPAGRLAVLLDPGGTSTEIAWGAAPRAEGAVSLPWGTHSIDRMLRRGGVRAGRGARRRAARSLRETFAPQCAAINAWSADSCLSAGRDAPTIMMTGGTAVALAVVNRFIRRAAPLRIEHELFEPVDIALTGSRIARACRAGSDSKYPLEPERRRLLPAGLVLVETLAELLGAPRPSAVARDLRWGGVLSGEPLPGGYLADE